MLKKNDKITLSTQYACQLGENMYNIISAPIRAWNGSENSRP